MREAILYITHKENENTLWKRRCRNARRYFSGESDRGDECPNNHIIIRNRHRYSSSENQAASKTDKRLAPKRTLTERIKTWPWWKIYVEQQEEEPKSMNTSLQGDCNNVEIKYKTEHPVKWWLEWRAMARTSHHLSASIAMITLCLSSWTSTETIRPRRQIKWRTKPQQVHLPTVNSGSGWDDNPEQWIVDRYHDQG